MANNPEEVKPSSISQLDTPKNLKRMEEFEKQAEKHEASITAAVKLFNPTALLARSTEIHEYNHPVLGIIKFGELTLADSEVTALCKSKSDKTAMAIYISLKKAYPDMPEFTPETIGGFFKQFPIVEGTALLEFLLGTPDFLPNGSPSGSATTETAKK